MDIQRTITILLPDDPDLRVTLNAFREVQERLSSVCYNGGKSLGALALQRACYHEVKGTLNVQMTITAMRLVSGAYVSAKHAGRPARRPFRFNRRTATFLVGRRGRDADFRADGTLSIWTVNGRKRIPFTVPNAFRDRLVQAKEIDSLTVVERNGRLLGRVVVTLDAPEPVGILPVGIDLNETNAVVAVDTDGRELFISGRATKVANRRTQKTRARVQRTHVARKAQGQDTHSVRRLLKRLGHRQRNRTRTFAQTAAKQLVAWAPPGSVLVFEALALPPVSRRLRGSPALRRRLSQWQRGQIRRFAEHKAQESGLLVAEVDPAYTSQTCSRCGLRGIRARHSFRCPSCSFAGQADLNAAVNIRNRFTAFRGSGLPSISPEAQAPAVGKLSASAGSH